jgi:hypothetical protein
MRIVLSIFFQFALIASLYSQDVLKEPEIEMPGRKFISFNQAVFPLGIFVAADKGIGSDDLVVPVTYEDGGSAILNIGYGGGLSFNMISPNSVVGFSLREKISYSKMYVSVDEDYDQIEYLRSETALLLKLNLTKDITDPVSFQFVIGPSFYYSFRSTSLAYGIDAFETASSGFVVGFSLEGQTFKDSDFSRFGMELLYSHSLTESLNQEYQELVRYNYNSFQEGGLGFLSLSLNYYLK